MASSSAHELTEFHIFARETVRAIIEIYQILNWRLPNALTTVDSLGERNQDLLTFDYHWPLVVQAGSDISNDIQQCIRAAKIRSERGQFWYQHCERYLVNHGIFYDTLLVDENGVPSNRQGVQIGWDSVYDASLGDDYCYFEFEKIKNAISAKAALYPHQSARTASWRSEFEQKVKSIARLDPKELLYRVNMDKVQETLSAWDAAQQVAASSSSSVSPNTPDAATGNVSDNHDLNITYQLQVVIKNSKETIKIDVTDMEDPLVTKTKEMWGWMVEKGLADKVALKDVVELAKKNISDKSSA